MPVYQVMSSVELDDERRQRLADEIGRIHTGNTGAPELFVHVVFTELPPGRVYPAGKPSRLSLVIGSIREGRPLEVRQTMLRQLAELWAEVTGAGPSEFMAAILEADPRSAMEHGLFFPAAGEEAAWFTQNRDHLLALGVVAG